MGKPVVLKQSTAQKLKRKLAEPEVSAHARQGFTPRDLERSPETYRFQISQSTTQIRVREGKWTRLGIGVTLATDGGEVYKSIGGPEGGGGWANSETYYVYLQLNSAVSDPGLFPSSVTVHAATSIPADVSPGSRNIYWVLGVVTTDGSGVLSSHLQWWWGGDIDDVSYVVDSVSAFNGPRYSSLGVAGAARPLHRGNLQIFEWDGPTEVEIEDPDLLMFQDVSEGNLPLRYITAEDLADYIGGELLDDEQWVEDIGDDLNENSRIFHTDLDFSDGGFSAWTDRGVGKGLGNTDHDESYLRTYDDDNFVNDKHLRTTGAIHADQFAIEDDALNQYWDADTFRADATTSWLEGTASLTLLSGGTIDMDAETLDADFSVDASIRSEGLLDLYSISGDIELTAISGDITMLAGAFVDIDCIDFDLDAPASIAMNSGWITLTAGGAGLHLDSSATLDLNPTGELQVNGVPGFTIADWWAKGIGIGIDITPVSIRTIPAGGGAPIEIEVLSRPA